MKKKRRINRASNAIDPATTTSKSWGFKPVPGKGGRTTNHDMTITDFEVRGIIHGRKEGAVNA